MLKDTDLRRLFRYGCALTGDEQRAFDLLQDALECSLRRAPVDLLPYVRSTMRNGYIDQQRRAKRYPEVDYDGVSDTLDIGTRTLEEVFIAEEQLDRVWPHLHHLEREILFLWALEGLSAREIGEELGMPRGSVLSRIHRLRSRLVEQFPNGAEWQERSGP